MIQVIVQADSLSFFCRKKMTWTWVLIGILVLLVIGLLFIPIRLYVNTLTHHYFASIGHLAKAYFEGDEKEIIRLRIRFMGLQFIRYPLNFKSRHKKIDKAKTKVKKRKLSARRVFQFIKSFKVHTFELNVDTGNYVTNAQLYPIFGFFNYHLANCNINYKQVNSLIIDIRSRPITLLKTFIHL